MTGTQGAPGADAVGGGEATEGVNAAGGTEADTAGGGMEAADAAGGGVDSAEGAGAVGWDALLSGALLGTDRRPVAAGAGDPAVALLDAAATATVRRRAGLRPAAAAARPAPAAPDARPPLPPAAARRLAQLLNDRAGSGGSGRGAAPSLAELLPQWLAAANTRGYRPPGSVLPALLDAARARTDLRAEALALAGPRGRWLAALNPDWRFAVRAGDRGAAGDAARDPAAARVLWEEGLFAERVAVLCALRAAAPDDGRELLLTTWAQERAEDRLMFLDTLRTGLGPADEEFLEASLSDRSRNVRSAAAELLSCLPGSALSHRVGVRAAACVAAGPGGRELEVTAPQVCDAATERDGVMVDPPSGQGQRAWWFGQLVEAAPLAVWEDRLGAAPARLVSLPVADGWREDLHGAWARAAVRQADAGWARALLGRPAPGTGSVAGDPARLLAVLPARQRADWVTEFVAAHGLSEAFQMLGACAVPWSRPLGRAVVDALDIARDAGSYPWSFSGVMGLAERCLDPADAERLEPFTVPGAPEEAAPGASGYWTEAFRRLVATLRLRAVMHAELLGDGAPAPGAAAAPAA